jgi:hypothetical protein
MQRRRMPFYEQRGYALTPWPPRRYATLSRRSRRTGTLVMVRTHGSGVRGLAGHHRSRCESLISLADRAIGGGPHVFKLHDRGVG